MVMKVIQCIVLSTFFLIRMDSTNIEDCVSSNLSMCHLFKDITSPHVFSSLENVGLCKIGGHNNTKQLDDGLFLRKV